MQSSFPPVSGDYLSSSDACVWSSIFIHKEDIIDWQDLAPPGHHHFDPMKEVLRGKIYANNEEVKRWKNIKLNW